MKMMNLVIKRICLLSLRALVKLKLTKIII
jgi:hypothetical protein